MNGVIGDILPLALRVAISPIAIIAAILMLLSARVGSTSTGLIGWILGIVVATGLFTALADRANSSTTISTVPRSPAGSPARREPKGTAP